MQPVLPRWPVAQVLAVLAMTGCERPGAPENQVFEFREGAAPPVGKRVESAVLVPPVWRTSSTRTLNRLIDAERPDAVIPLE